MKKLFFLFLTSFLSLYGFSSGWLKFDDRELNIFLNEAKIKCGLPLHNSHSKLSYKDIEIKIKKLMNLETEDVCKNKLDKILDLIEYKFEDSKIIGFQSGINDIYLQDRYKKNYQKSNLYYQSYKFKGNFLYHFNILSDSKGDVIFDDSYIGFKLKDQIISVGKINRWWSSSNETSLILSNSARPPLSIELSSYASMNSEYPVLSIFRDFNYEIFISKLERNRHIPNTMLFGNRFTFSPFEKINFSLLRVAQYGGKNRVTNSSTIKRMITGKDNTNRNLSFEEQSGNQIAGIDFSCNCSKNNNLVIYGQYMGEDGLDPIIDDRWIGAIFPSKRFYMAGLRYTGLDRNFLPWTLTLENVNTDSGFKNVTYNHGLYKSGYRYYGSSIGANIDADSDNIILAFKKHFGKNTLKLKFQNYEINQNNSHRNSWSNESFELNELSFLYVFNLNKNINISINASFKDREILDFKKNNLFFRIEYSI